MERTSAFTEALSQQRGGSHSPGLRAFQTVDCNPLGVIQPRNQFSGPERALYFCFFKSRTEEKYQSAASVIRLSIVSRNLLFQLYVHIYSRAQCITVAHCQKKFENQSQELSQYI